jgi:single-strand DNA-binding protein
MYNCNTACFDLNRVHLTGELASEPLLYDVGDHPVARLALASRRSWIGPGNRLQLATTWFELTAWEALAEQCGRLLHRGDRVYVEGRLHLWHERRGRQSLLCHSIILDRIELLAAGRGDGVSGSAGGEWCSPWR